MSEDLLRQDRLNSIDVAVRPVGSGPLEGDEYETTYQFRFKDRLWNVAVRSPYKEADELLSFIASGDWTGKLVSCSQSHPKRHCNWRCKLAALICGAVMRALANEKGHYH